MVGCVAGAVEGAECRAFCCEGLAVADLVPFFIAGVVFVDFCAGRVGEQVRDALGVVWVPVCDERGGDGDVFLRQDRFERGDPFGFAFGGVDEEA